MIKVTNLSKSFKLYTKPSDRLLEIVLRKQRHRILKAINNVSFEVKQGEALGIIGQNGAGKSTLLKMLTGVLLPDAGKISIDGRITGLLELGTGFNHEFSGLENIYLNGAFLGLTKKELDRERDSIVDFTELGDFVREPLKTYSTGMVMRLAFAIAIHAKPKAFVVDEALSVGDVAFQQKCLNRIKDFRELGGSIVFVSHDLNAVKVLCDQAILLKKGEVMDRGEPDQVINSYNMLIAKRDTGRQVSRLECGGSGASYGNQKVLIKRVDLSAGNDRGRDVLVSGGPCAIEISLEAMEDIPDLTVGVLIRDRLGQDIFGVNTHHLKAQLSMLAGCRRDLRFCFDNFNLGPGKYTLTVAAHSLGNHIEDCFHWIDSAKSFEVLTDGKFIFIGFARLEPKLLY